MNKAKQKKKKTSNLLTWTLVSHLRFWNANMVFEGPIKSISCIVCAHINRLHGLNPQHHKWETLVNNQMCPT